MLLRQHFRTVDSIRRILDLTCIAVAFVLSLWCNRLFFSSLPDSQAHLELQYYNIQHLLFVTSALLMWAGLARYIGIYRSHRAEPVSFTLRLLLKTIMVWMVTIAFSLFALKDYETFNRGLIALFFTYSSLLLTLRMLLMIAFLHGLRRRGYNVRRVAIVGEAAHAQSFAKFVEQKREIGYEVAEIKEIHSKDAPMAGVHPRTRGHLHTRSRDRVDRPQIIEAR